MESGHSWLRSPDGPSIIPHLRVGDINSVRQPHHLQAVQKHLQHKGILKISLGFPDDNSRYLHGLILGLSKFHSHGLPLDHSASQGWFWDIRPSAAHFQSNSHQARSETMQDFPWHTDCSYEASPPRYFALQVLRPDRRGGGTFSALGAQHIIDRLSPSSQAALCRPEFRISVPPEFVRSGAGDSIVGSVLAADGPGAPRMIRFREDIITPLTAEAGTAMDELRRVLLGQELRGETLHLGAESMPRGSVLLLDNRRWLHARNEVRDPERHLRRVRWDATPFASTPVSVEE